ncbi:MAG: type II secretion system GspH family protein [Synergistaceae bacterium]|jgi:prepilin-type N-terminal cleavage/methylation domain-containing protein|nr:type II secretion system GspH family protein [Synergistaceae bacterium]
MNCSRERKAFTLAEILVVVAIAGIIVVTGITPLMYTVRMIRDARAAFASDDRERTALNRILTDMRGTVRINMPTSFRIMHDDKLERNADYLMLWTKTPAYEMVPMGGVVYGVPDVTILGKFPERGLYRWVLSGDVRLDSLSKEDLEKEDALLVLPRATGVAFHALSGSEWMNEFSGAMPRAVRVTFEYGSNGDKIYERWLPKF